MQKLLFAEKDGVHVLKFIGDVRVTLGPTINTFLATMLNRDQFKTVIIDLTETVGIDSTSLGMLAKISIQTQEQFCIVPTIISTNDDITRILLSMGFDQVFMILKEPLDESVPLGELPCQSASDKPLRSQVLEAHRVLMELNESNRETFQDLVLALQHEQDIAS